MGAFISTLWSYWWGSQELKIVMVSEHMRPTCARSMAGRASAAAAVAAASVFEARGV